MKAIQIPSPQEIAAAKQRALEKVRQLQLKEKAEILKSLLKKAKSSLQSMIPKE